MQTISVILGVVLLGIGANDATADEDWLCAPSDRIRDIMPPDGDGSADVFKWIGMCYSQTEGECEEGWGDGRW